MTGAHFLSPALQNDDVQKRHHWFGVKLMQHAAESLWEDDRVPRLSPRVRQVQLFLHTAGNSSHSADLRSVSRLCSDTAGRLQTRLLQSGGLDLLWTLRHKHGGPRLELLLSSSLTRWREQRTWEKNTQQKSVQSWEDSRINRWVDGKLISNSFC